MLTILDTGRDGYQWNQQTQASVYPQKDFVLQATIFLCVKHGHQNQASGGNGVHGEGHQGQGGVPQLVVSCARSPVFSGRGKREGREDKSVRATTGSDIHRLRHALTLSSHGPIVSVLSQGHHFTSAYAPSKPESTSQYEKNLQVQA